jgi:hypothetical protein
MQNNNIPDIRSELQEKNKNAIQKQELIPSSLLQLQEQEEIIQKGLMGFMVAGTALRKIKENKLYGDNYSTYDAYCQQRWNFTPQHANRLIKAATVVEEIKSESIGSVLPQSEAQARALLKSKNPVNDWLKIQEQIGEKQPIAKDIEIFIKAQNKKEDVIDVEIAEETHEDIPCEAIDDSSEETEQGSIVLLLKDIINTPYKKGVITGRPQISVEADDDSVERLERLKESLHSSKSSVVSQGLIFLEQSLEYVSDTSL